MKQQSFASMNLPNAMDSIFKRLSIAESISHFLANGCFFLSDSLRGRRDLTAFREEF